MITGQCICLTEAAEIHLSRGTRQLNRSVGAPGPLQASQAETAAIGSEEQKR